MHMQTPNDYESAWRDQTPTPVPAVEPARPEKKRARKSPGKDAMYVGMALLGAFLLAQGAWGTLGPVGNQPVPIVSLDGIESHYPGERATSFIDDLPQLLIQDNLSAHPFSEQRLLNLMCESSDGAQFDCDEVKAALAELNVDWNDNALKSAEITLEQHPLSQAMLFEVLSSPDGHGFTEEQARYAVEHVNADWRKNALEAAKRRQAEADLPEEQLFLVLTDPLGEAFTEDQAQWALEQLRNPAPEAPDAPEAPEHLPA